jgi:hypothetical protein
MAGTVGLRADSPAGSAAAAAAHRYLAAVLDVMQRNALGRHHVDWVRVRQHAFAEAAAMSTMDTYPAIGHAVGVLNKPAHEVPASRRGRGGAGPPGATRADGPHARRPVRLPRRAAVR